MQHYIAYEGVHVALALLLEEYGALHTQATNLRIDVAGTLQRPPYFPSMWTDWLVYLSKNKGKHEAFAILVRDADADGGWRYLGSTDISHIRWPLGDGTTGSMIINSEAQGKGYGTEAKLLLLKHGFHTLGLRKLYSSVKAWNAQSLGHLLKCGYRIVGRYREGAFDNGRFVDQLLLEVFETDWEPVWNRYQAAKELPRLTDAQRELIKKETHAS